MDFSLNNKLIILIGTVFFIVLIAPNEVDGKLRKKGYLQGEVHNDTDAQAACSTMKKTLQFLRDIVNKQKRNDSDDAEVFVALDNTTRFDCHGVKDCVTVAITILVNLPPMLKVSKAFYARKLHEIQDEIFSMLKAQTHEELMKLAEKALSTISIVECLSLHCASPPEVTLRSPSQIIAEIGDVVILHCEVRSALPAKLFWTHGNRIIDGEHLSTLTIHVDLDSVGAYTCFATSMAGNGTASSKTRLLVVSAPAFIEEPSNATYITPSKNKVNLALTCNATGLPQPTISWYFSPCNEPKLHMKIKEGSEMTLAFDNPTERNNGFYYCKANNTVNEITSRVVKVNVLYALPASAQLNISFLIRGVGGLKESLFKSLLNKMKKELGDWDANIHVMISHGSSVTIVENVGARGDYKRTFKQLSEQLTKLRQDVDDSATVFLNILSEAGFMLKLDDGRTVHVDFDSLRQNRKLDICKDGYKLHDNGFMCVQCPCGFAGHECHVCPKNMFADRSAQKKCTACKGNNVTIHIGSTSSSQCILKPNCTNPCKHGKCVGKNLCKCDQGWEGNQCDKAICRRACKHGTCIGDNKCQCKVGWNGKQCSQDIDECKFTSLNKCNQICKNRDGSFVCSCNPGYILGSDKHTCKDIDECRSPSLNKCAQICNNKDGYYVCSCKPGYGLLSDRKTCKDIDECQSASLNKCNQICKNTNGSYACSCKPGYRLLSDKKTCQDIDECQSASLNKCSQICNNNNGSYTCSCKPGYRLLADRTSCEDIDECQSASLNKCNHICKNTNGSYVCSCKPGYHLLSDRKTCQDIDECQSASLNKCSQICNNNNGSYTCSCKPGYRLLADKRSCQDIDECQSVSLNNCSQICKNNDGSYVCSCKPGYRLLPDGRTCIARTDGCDIVILLDISTQFIRDAAFKSNVIKFIKDYLKNFKGDTSKRFGFTTFDALAYTRLRVEDYKDTDQVSQLVTSIDPTNSAKKTWVGLTTVRTEQHFIKNSKKIVLVITDGFSEGDVRFEDGFHMARKEALLIREKGIHLISVGMTTNVDTPELRAMASYPKLVNTIINRNDKLSLSTAIRVTQDVLTGKCYQPLLDIGVLFKPRHYRSTKEYFSDQKKLLTLFEVIYTAIPDTKYYFNSFQKPGDKYSFETYSLSLLKRIIKTYHRSQTYWFDIMRRSKEVLAHDFDEKDRTSLSKIKSFMIITVNALSEQEISDLSDAKGEVDVINFVLDPKSITKVESGKKVIFSFQEVQLYIKALKEKRSKSICS